MENKKQIVSTASLPVECLQRLEQFGFATEVIPFIQTSPLVNETNAQRIKELQHKNITAVFTSAHGVAAVAASLDHQPVWNIASINGATLESVSINFTKGKVIATAPHAKQLAKEIISYAQERIVFFCGNKRLNIIPQQLGAAGIVVEEIEVYQTELTPQKVKGKIEAVLFFSSSAVESFFMENDLPATAICFAIGETTAEAIRNRAGNQIIVSGNPGKKEMIELIIHYYHEHS